MAGRWLMITDCVTVTSQASHGAVAVQTQALDVKSHAFGVSGDCQSSFHSTHWFRFNMEDSAIERALERRLVGGVRRDSESDLGECFCALGVVRIWRDGLHAKHPHPPSNSRDRIQRVKTCELFVK